MMQPQKISDKDNCWQNENPICCPAFVIWYSGFQMTTAQKKQKM